MSIATMFFSLSRKCNISVIEKKDAVIEKKNGRYRLVRIKAKTPQEQE